MRQSRICQLIRFNRTDVVIYDLDPKLVMATQSVHDAVKQPESADAPSPADVPELKTTDPAVRAAPTAQIDSTESATAASAEPGSTHLAYNEEVVKSVNAEAYEHNKGVSDASEVSGPVVLLEGVLKCLGWWKCANQHRKCGDCDCQRRSGYG